MSSSCLQVPSQDNTFAYTSPKPKGKPHAIPYTRVHDKTKIVAEFGFLPPPRREGNGRPNLHGHGQRPRRCFARHQLQHPGTSQPEKAEVTASQHRCAGHMRKTHTHTPVCFYGGPAVEMQNDVKPSWWLKELHFFKTNLRRAPHKEHDQRARRRQRPLALPGSLA